MPLNVKLGSTQWLVSIENEDVAIVVNGDSSSGSSCVSLASKDQVEN